MDIAIISEHASPIEALGGTDAGGQNVYVAQLAKHLVQLGHTVEVFTRCDSFELPLIQNLKEGFRLINVPAGPASPVQKEKLLPYMNEFTSFMLSYIRERRKAFDVIHANFFMSALVAADLKKIIGIPFVTTFHALGKVRKAHQGDNDAFPIERLAIEERVVQESDRIIAECPQDLEDLLYYYNGSTEKIDVIPCGFDNHEMRPIDKFEARKKLGLDDIDEMVLHLGRMVPRKGADNIIRGFAQFIKARERKKCCLVIVGGESDKPDPLLTPEIGRLMAIAKDEGISDYVIFTGRRGRDSLKLYYSAADVFVTTPWYEPFGITPLESMACGTPVIGSSVGGIKFSVTHGETGLLVPPKAPKALKEALDFLMNNKKLREQFGKRSVERVNRLFRWDMMARQIEKIIEKKVLVKPTVPESMLVFQAAEVATRNNFYI